MTVSFPRLRVGLLTLVVVAAVAACSKNEVDTVEPVGTDDVNAGGAATVFSAGSNAYSLPAPNLRGGSGAQHLLGDAAFERRFVTADGLGPLFINANCTACHVRDGRGTAPLTATDPVQMLFRLSLTGQDAHGGPRPVPGFGDQLQNRAIVGTNPEGQLSIHYVEQLRTLIDGTSVSLRKPTYAVDAPYSPLPAGVLLSPRVAPPVFGLGLLEAVSEANIVARADENDADGDGISGRPNYVWDVAAQAPRLGRFGWKANQPSLRQQTAAAYNGDMGITTSLFPLEPAAGQSQAGNQPPGSAPADLADTELANTTFYVQTLGVPARRDVKTDQVKAGKALFVGAKCASCHVPRLATGAIAGLPAEMAGQTIYPYTDLLLHDMGPGLADNRPDFRASGNEWRTPPLWGIGLSEVVNGHSTFMHDGRARSLTEAILWHGGEAQASADAVGRMSAADRAKLLAFLQSL
ncbi:di-heme oxidoredictase family protein [Hymenobacter glaciei]|uniref:Di-heme oxidoredictase family protein n=1 Tax=Hymenobacter glaciei TaxID=877209 RepID=A0ABP7TH25_9BACT